MSDRVARLLGLEGISLLRAIAGDGFGSAFVGERLDEVERILAARRDPAFADGPAGAPIDVRAGYDLWAATYDQPNPLITVEQKVVRPWLERLPPGRALDAACGTGRYAGLLAGRGHEVLGVDASPGMLAAARRNVPAARFARADLGALPLGDGSVDLVVCALALTHQPALGPALAEFARVLRPGGELVVSDIHVASLYLGGVAGVVGPDGRRRVLPATRLLASDYLRATRHAGFAVADCAEPRWGTVDGEGGPLAQAWCPAAAAAAYRDTPAAICWRFTRDRARGPLTATRP